MRISDLRMEQLPDADQVSASIGGFRLWYRVTPGIVRAVRPEAFVAAGLLPAMASGEALELDEGSGVSQRLLEGLDQLQEVFCTWNGALSRVPVLCRTESLPPSRLEVATFFSGGVDGQYTFLDRQHEISHLVQIHGFEYRRENRSLAEEAERRNREFAVAHSRQLVVVETNARDFYESCYIHPTLHHGGLLASVALALGFATVYVPASGTWSQLTPWGSHPVTDPLWSSQATTIAHHGTGVTRVEKLRRISQSPRSLDLLRVCFRNSVYNCGNCEKCVRTRAALRILGLRSANLPALNSTRPVRRLRLDSESDRQIWTENRTAARAAGDAALERAISVALARYDISRALRSIDSALPAGGGRRLLALGRRLVARRAPERPELRVTEQE